MHPQLIHIDTGIVCHSSTVQEKKNDLVSMKEKNDDDEIWVTEVGWPEFCVFLNFHSLSEDADVTFKKKYRVCWNKYFY